MGLVSEEGDSGIALTDEGVSQPRVLYVADDPGDRRRVERALEREFEDVRFRVAETVTEAVTAVQEEDVDCVVSEYALADGDGIELLGEVRERWPLLPFVLYADRGADGIASETVSAGVTEYVPRDRTDPTALGARVADAVARYRAERTRRLGIETLEVAEGTGVGIVDDAGAIVYLNETYADLHDEDRESLLGSRWERLHPPGERRRFREEVLPRVERDGEWSGRFVGERADGSVFREYATIRRLPAGGHVRIVRVEGGTETRRRRLRRLHEAARTLVGAESIEAVAEETVRAAGDVLDLPNAAVHLLDGEGRLEPVSYSEGVVQLLGREPPTIEPGSGLVWDAFDAGEPRRYDDVTRHPDVLNRRTPVRAELHLPIGDRGVLIVATADPTVRFSDDDVELGAALAVHAAEALDRIDDTRGLRERARWLDAVVENTSDAIYVKDEDGRYQFVNEAAAEALGGDPEEIVGKRDADLLPEEAAATVRANDREVIETGESLSTREELSADGERRLFRSEKHPYETAAGEVTGVVGISRDVTERDRQKRRLEHTNERLEEFTSIVSHDLKSPLSIAAQYLELAREDGDQEYLEKVADAHDRMERLIDDLLTLAKQGEVVGEPEPVDLASVVRESWRGVATDGVTLKNAASGTVMADRGRLGQLLSNLFQNSVEHGAGEDGDVTVRVGEFEDDGERGLYVEDDGPGIPEGEHDRIFEHGYSTSQEGTGFGLNIVKRIAEAHGWDVRATESAEGGARFEIVGLA